MTTNRLKAEAGWAIETSCGSISDVCQTTDSVQRNVIRTQPSLLICIRHVHGKAYAGFPRHITFEWRWERFLGCCAMWSLSSWQTASIIRAYHSNAVRTSVTSVNSTRLHGEILPERVAFILTAARTWNLTQFLTYQQIPWNGPRPLLRPPFYPKRDL